VVGCRWTIESAFEQVKQEVWLDDFEVCSADGCHQQVTLTLLAQAVLEVLRVSASTPQEHRIDSLIPLTLPEVRRLLARLLWPVATPPPQWLEWSTWRRKHQAVAQKCHYKTRKRFGEEAGKFERDLW